MLVRDMSAARAGYCARLSHKVTSRPALSRLTNRTVLVHNSLRKQAEVAGRAIHEGGSATSTGSDLWRGP